MFDQGLPNGAGLFFGRNCDLDKLGQLVAAGWIKLDFKYL
jgi:hypothetical protein